jgi:hypothetical protein
MDRGAIRPLIATTAPVPIVPRLGSGSHIRTEARSRRGSVLSPWGGMENPGLIMFSWFAERSGASRDLARRT